MVAAPFILPHSVIGLAAVFLAGQRLADQAEYYGAAAIVGAAFGTRIGLKFMSDRATRYVFAGIILFAGFGSSGNEDLLNRNIQHQYPNHS